MAHLDSGAVTQPRVRWGFLAAVLLCLPGLLVTRRLESDAQLSLADPYMVGMQAERLAGVQAAVPPGAILGYVTDLDGGSTAAQAIFNSAQYTLAPRLLAPGVKREWVLGNFARPADFDAFGRSRGLQMVRDFGNGVVLYKGAAR
jgi:hypothetical protein